MAHRFIAAICQEMATASGKVGEKVQKVCFLKGGVTELDDCFPNSGEQIFRACNGHERLFDLVHGFVC
jgi:hypothetical protein